MFALVVYRLKPLVEPETKPRYAVGLHPGEPPTDLAAPQYLDPWIVVSLHHWASASWQSDRIAGETNCPQGRKLPLWWGLVSTVEERPIVHGVWTKVWLYAPAAQILTRIKSGLDWVFSVNQSRCVPFSLFIKVKWQLSLKVADGYEWTIKLEIRN